MRKSTATIIPLAVSVFLILACAALVLMVSFTFSYQAAREFTVLHNHALTKSEKQALEIFLAIPVGQYKALVYGLLTRDIPAHLFSSYFRKCSNSTNNRSAGGDGPHAPSMEHFYTDVYPYLIVNMSSCPPFVPPQATTNTSTSAPISSIPPYYNQPNETIDVVEHSGYYLTNDRSCLPELFPPPSSTSNGGSSSTAPRGYYGVHRDLRTGDCLFNNYSTIADERRVALERMRRYTFSSLIEAGMKLFYVAVVFREGTAVYSRVSTQSALLPPMAGLDADPAQSQVISTVMDAFNYSGGNVSGSVFRRTIYYNGSRVVGEDYGNSSFDGRQRSWYRDSPKRYGMKPVFSKVYVDATLNMPVIDINGPVFSPIGDLSLRCPVAVSLAGIASITLDLRQISVLLRATIKTPNSFSAVIDENLYVLGTSIGAGVPLWYYENRSQHLYPGMPNHPAGCLWTYDETVAVCRYHVKAYPHHPLLPSLAREFPDILCVGDDGSMINKTRDLFSDSLSAEYVVTTSRIQVENVERSSIQWLLLTIVPLNDMSDQVTAGRDLSLALAGVVVVVATIICTVTLWFLLRQRVNDHSPMTSRKQQQSESSKETKKRRALRLALHSGANSPTQKRNSLHPSRSSKSAPVGGISDPKTLEASRNDFDADISFSDDWSSGSSSSDGSKKSFSASFGSNAGK